MNRYTIHVYSGIQPGYACVWARIAGASLFREGLATQD